MVSTTAQKEAMMIEGWVWLSFESRVVTLQELGWLYIRPRLPSERMQAFAEQVSDHTSSSLNISTSANEVDLTYSVALHDAIMLYALAATRILTKGGDLSDAKAVTEAVRSTKFQGVGGSDVDLDEKGDRVESYEVMNYVADAGSGVIGAVPVGLYNSTNQQYTANSTRAVVWIGNTLEVPVDYIPGSSDCSVHGVVHCYFHACLMRNAAGEA